jgi:hypothetical protein
MLAHHKPDNGSGAVFAADLRAILTDRYLAGVAGPHRWPSSTSQRTHRRQADCWGALAARSD